MVNAHHSKLSIREKLRLMVETEKQNKARWDEFFAQQAAQNQKSGGDHHGSHLDT